MAEEIASPRNRLGIKTLLLICGLIFLSAILHLIAPWRSENWKPAHLNKSLTYYYNVDSSEYAYLIVTFPRGFELHNFRRHRPLYSTLGFIVYKPLCLFKPLVPHTLCQRATAAMADGGGDRIWKGLDARNIVIAWAALIIVNFILYAASFILIVLALQRIFDPSVALVLAMYPALHRDMIGFLLVPTAECFNVLLPAIFLYSATVIWPARKSGAATAMALGVGMLGKPMLYVFCNWPFEHLVIMDWRRGWRQAVVCGVLFVAPMVLYAALLLAVGLPLHCHEAAHDRQFVWMVDAFQESRFLCIPWRWLTGLATHASHVLIGWAAAISLCAILAFMKDRKPFVLDPHLKKHILIYVLSAAAFWVLGSVFFFRMSVYYYPAVIVLLGALATRKLARPAAFLMLGPLLQTLDFVVVNLLR